MHGNAMLKPLPPMLSPTQMQNAERIIADLEASINPPSPAPEPEPSVEVVYVEENQGPPKGYPQLHRWFG
jgi:hypothetical protein